MPTIKETRQKLGLSQQQMGQLMGMAQQNIAAIENGRDGRKETRQHLAMLRVLLFLHECGLIDELLGEI